MTNKTMIGLAACAGLAVLLLTALQAPAVVSAAIAAVITWSLMTHAERRCGERHDRAMASRIRALRQREEQLTNTAHELRTPLTAVSTAIDLLRDGHATTPEDTELFLEQASVAAHHMGFLINDVVDLASLENGKLSLHNRPQRVHELLFDVAQVMRLTAKAHGVELRLEEPADDLVVIADRGRFLQVVFNLLANAIKFSGGGQLVHVSIESTEGSVRFEVRDQGPGVPTGLQDQLFTRFGRIHDRSNPAVQGTGIGLFVCKLLIEHMGGQIGFRPGDESGSVFWFALRRCPPSQLLAPGEAAAAAVGDAEVAIETSASA